MPRFFVEVPLPSRPNIEPFETVLAEKYTYDVRVLFPEVLRLEHMSLVAHGWTLVHVEWDQPFALDPEDFVAWLHTGKAIGLFASTVERVIASVVEALKGLHPDDRSLAPLRHFGVKDWAFIRFGQAGGAERLVLGVHAEHQFRSITTRICDGKPFSIPAAFSSFQSRALLRASDLAEMGYPTEASLIAFAALDAAVQTALARGMKVKSVSDDAAQQILRNITTKRLATYLDGVLKLVYGRTISEDPDLQKKISDANRSRNEAIHNGKELSRAEAVESIQTVYAAFLFLRSIDPAFFPEVMQPETHSF